MKNNFFLYYQSSISVLSRSLLKLRIFNFWFLIIILFAITIFFIGCVKDFELFNSKPMNDSIQYRKWNEIFPVNVDNTLKFRNIQHLIEYYAFIDSIANLSDHRDSVLNEIENSLGFISSRSLTPTEFSDFTEIELNDSNFIADDIRKSILNQFNEYEIGDTTYIYQNKDEIYKVLSTDRNVISELRSTPKGTILPDLLFSENTFLLSSERTNRKVEIIESSFDPDPCKSSISSFTDHNCKNEFVGKVSAYCEPGFCFITVRIDWGDNSVIETYDSPNVIYAKHNYLTEGTYKIKVFFYVGCEQKSIIHENTFIFAKECFGDAETNEGYSYKQLEDGSYVYLDYDIWTITDIIGTWAGAKITAFQGNNGKISKIKAKLKVEINSTFKNKNCIIEDSEKDNDRCNSCKSKTVKVREDWAHRYHNDNDVWASYEAVIKGHTLNAICHIQYCP